MAQPESTSGGVQLPGQPITEAFDIVPTGAVEGQVEVALPVLRPPEDGEVVYVQHVHEDGSELLEGAWDPEAGVIRFTTNRFSIFQGWSFDPTDWLVGAVDSAADFITARTDPPDCADDPPPWASSSGATATGAVHVCWQANADGGVELLLKSNRRSQTHVVTVPAQATYVWVESQPSSWMRQAASSVAGVSPGSNVVLPGGETMSIGFSQPEAVFESEVAIYQTPATILFDGARFALGLVGATTGDLETDLLITLLTVDRCFGLGTGLDFRPDPDFGGAFRCAIDKAVGGLASQSAFGIYEGFFEREGIAVDSTEIRNKMGKARKVSVLARAAGAVLSAAKVVETFAFVHDQMIINLLGDDLVTISLIPRSDSEPEERSSDSGIGYDSSEIGLGQDETELCFAGETIMAVFGDGFSVSVCLTSQGLHYQGPDPDRMGDRGAYVEVPACRVSEDHFVASGGDLTYVVKDFRLTIERSGQLLVDEPLGSDDGLGPSYLYMVPNRGNLPC